MKISRRDFLKLSGASMAAAGLAGLGFGASVRASQAMKVHYARESVTICAYCSGGCGIILHVKGNELVGLEGDPDHPINLGSLCSKANSMVNLRQIYDRAGSSRPNPHRLTKVLYRAPKSTKWEEKSWDWALPEIAKRIKATRDASFELQDLKGVTVNRTFAIGHLGSAALDNEENYAILKFLRALGVVNLDHHARL